MGKIIKYHISAEKRDSKGTIKNERLNQKHMKFQLNAVQNVFAGINIQLSDINKFEEAPPLTKESKQKIEGKVEPTQPDEISTKTSHGSVPIIEKNLTKKEKIALKHQKLMEKLDVTEHARLQSQRKNRRKEKQTNNAGKQTVLKSSQQEVSTLLTPAAIKPSKQYVKGNVAKNIPLFNDDLPSINSIFEIPKNNFCIQSKSKSILKTSYRKKGFVKNYNFLKKAMATKRS